MSFFRFSDNVLQDAYIIFPNGVNNFEIAHKICSILILDALPPKVIDLKGQKDQKEIVLVSMSSLRYKRNSIHL